MWYCLNESYEAFPCSAEEAFSEEMQNRKVVNKTVLDALTVSTVFLFLNHAFSFEEHTSKVRILWETCVFEKDKGSQVVSRYTSYTEACLGHEKICDQIKNLMNQNE